MDTRKPYDNASAAWRLALTLSSGAVLLLWFYFFDPAKADVFLPCPFRLATGWLCPGCGTQRAVHLFLHGDFLAAFHSNPLAVILVPLVGYIFVEYFAGDAFGAVLPEIRMGNAVIWISISLVSAYWIARNMPWWNW